MNYPGYAPTFKSEIYQLFSALIRNIGGELGVSLRRHFYRLAGAKLGKGAIIRENVFISRPYNLKLGDYCEIGTGAILSAVKGITLEDGAGVGPYSSVYDNDHKMPKKGGEDNLISNPIFIGKDSWIGAHSVILRGTKIGKNVTIAAGSVVHGSIPDNAVVMGNPGRIIKLNRKI